MASWMGMTSCFFWTWTTHDPFKIHWFHKSSIQLFPQLPQPQRGALDRGWAPNWSIATMSSPCSTRRSSPIPCCRGRWRSGTCWEVGLVGSMFHDQHGDLYGDIYIYIIYIYMGFASKILVFRYFYNHQINPKNPKNSIPPFKLHRYSIGLSSLPLKTIQPQVVKCYPLVNHGSLNVPMGHITQPWMVYGKNNGYYFRWCPIYPKWDIYQSL